MTKLKKLNERLQPLKVLLASVVHDEDRIIVADYVFVTDELILILADRHTGQEAKINLTKEEVNDFTDEFFKLIEFTETPNYWYLKDLSTSAFRMRAFKEIKDILLFKVNPLYSTIKILEEAA